MRRLWQHIDIGVGIICRLFVSGVDFELPDVFLLTTPHAQAAFNASLIVATARKLDAHLSV